MIQMFIQNIKDNQIRDEFMLEIFSDKDVLLILESVKDSPKNINQLCIDCKIPTSTTYRKVQKLAEYGILQRIGKIEFGKRITSYKSNTHIIKNFSNSSIVKLK